MGESVGAARYAEGVEQLAKLTALTVAKLVRTAKPGYAGDGGGLYLQVSKGGSASWAFRYRVDGKLREMGLGGLQTISLAEAREKALEHRKTLTRFRDGETDLDPIDQRRAARQRRKLEGAMTFRACAEHYIAANKAGWSNDRHAAQWPSSLSAYAYPIFGDLPVAAISTALVTKAIEPIWATKPETASRVRGRIESVLDWAKSRGLREGENPARWRGHLENLLPKKTKVRRVEHLAALPYVEIADFMVELRRQDGVPARALEFAILTAARAGEVIGAKWSEINEKDRLWIVPAERMKARKTHRVPLSDEAMAVIGRMAEIREGEFVFPGARPGQPLSSAAFRVLRRMGRADLTAHGFRSSFADWCTERTAFASEARELALAHSVGSKVEAAYRRTDLFEKRRQLADAWARYCAGQPAGEVVPLRTAAAE
jgi:integrase